MEVGVDLIEHVEQAFKDYHLLSRGQLLAMFGVNDKEMGEVLGKLVAKDLITLDDLNPSVWILIKK